MRIKIRQTLAILLCAVLLLALAPAGFAVDLTIPNTVTVNLVPNDKSAYQEDLANASIQADFYLLSAAVAPDNQSDSYTYALPLIRPSLRHCRKNWTSCSRMRISTRMTKPQSSTHLNPLRSSLPVSCLTARIIIRLRTKQNCLFPGIRISPHRICRPVCICSSSGDAT